MSTLICVALAAALVNRIEPPLAAIPVPVVPASAGSNILEGRTLDAVRRRLDDAYRIDPDRRFMLAIEELDEILGREHPAPGEASFEDGAWSLVSGGVRARVSEYPDFKELFAFVRSCAEERLRGGSTPFRVANSGADQTYPTDPLAALREIDRRDPVDLAAAAHAYAALLLSHEDTLETSDEVVARAIAVLALAEHLGGQELVRPRVLIAFRLGYEREAEEMAAGLAPSDPTRLFAEHRDEALASLAMPPDVPVDVALMYAHGLAKSGRQEHFSRYVESRRPEVADDFGILALDAEYGMASGPDWKLLVHAIRDLALASGTQLAIEPHLLALGAAEEVIQRLLSAPPYGLLGLAESMLAKLDSQSSGRIFDAATRAAVYRARIYTAFDSVASDLVARLNSESASAQFAALLGEGTSASAEQFGNFLDARIAAQEKRLTPREVVAHIEQLEFGPASLDVLFQPVNDGDYDAAWLHALKLMYQRADTRVRHREIAAELAEGALFDIALSEQLGRSVAREWPHSAYWHAILAYRDGDLAGVQKWLTDGSVSSWIRAKLMALVEDSDAFSDGDIRALYEQLIEIDPSEWSVVDEYVEYLDQHHAHSDARRVISDWLARPDRHGGMDELDARSSLARAYQGEGNLEAAWQAVVPPLQGMYGRAFSRAALIRLDQENFAEAEAIARAHLDRYPRNVFAAARLARVFWRQGRYDEAAAALKEKAPQIALIEWRRQVGPDFIDEFSAAPAEQVGAAAASLVQAGFDEMVLDELSSAARDAKQPALAVELLSHVKKMTAIFHGYVALKKWRGDEEAMRWVRERAPAAAGDVLATYSYWREAHDLPWELVPDPAGHSGPEDFVWVVRAASYLRDGAARADWRARLDAHYANAPGSWYDQLGAMMLGRLEPSLVWSVAAQPDQRVEAAYYIALRAEAAGDLETAIAWYRVALEGNLWREGETHWSMHQLYRLSRAGKSVDRLRIARGVIDQIRGT